MVYKEDKYNGNYTYLKISFIIAGWLVSSSKQMVEGDNRKSSIRSSLVTPVWEMYPLWPKMICVALSMVRALNLGVLFKGIDGARRALSLHLGGGVQVSGGVMVMVSCSFLLISLF